MTAATITSNAVVLILTFNDAAAEHNTKTEYIPRRAIELVRLPNDAASVVVRFDNGSHTNFSASPAKGSITIGTVDGAAPADNDALALALANLIL